MKWLIALLGLIASSACSARPPEAEFALDMLDRLRKTMPGADLTIKLDEPLVVLVKEGGGWEEAQINLHRVFGYCRNASAADCEASKAELASKVGKKPPPVTRASLRLIVRDSQYLDYALSMSKDEIALVIHQPIGSDLHALLASDSPEATALVTSQHLDEMKLNRRDAWALAFA